MTGAPRRGSNKFEPERFEAKINLRIHQAAGMNREEFHLFRTGVDLVELQKRLCLWRGISEFLRVMLARRAYFESHQLWPGSSIPAQSG